MKRHIIRAGGKHMGTAAARAKKITVDIPRSLYEEAERLVREREITTSILVRQAVEKYLGDIRRERLEQELREGYLANDALGDKIHREFAAVDAEQSE